MPQGLSTNAVMVYPCRGGQARGRVSTQSYAADVRSSAQRAPGVGKVKSMR